MPLHIGWSETDITPTQLPFAILGQLYSRISEGVDDPLQASVCVIDSGQDHVVFVSCDLIFITDEIRDRVRSVIGTAEGLEPQKIVFHATHTHTGPEIRNFAPGEGHASAAVHGVELECGSIHDYVEFASQQISRAIRQAWRNRKAGSVAYGLDYAVVGRNRRWVDASGNSAMYNLNADSAERFRHFEGYEDHSLNLLATYDMRGALTGFIVNVPSPSQHSESEYHFSADYWSETRMELRKRLGPDLFILPQCSAAGELTQRVIFENRANNRMLELRQRTLRQEIAIRIADAVERILPWIESSRTDDPELRHQVDILELPANVLTENDVSEAQAEADKHRAIYESEKSRLEADPALRLIPRWYVPVTAAFSRMSWHLGVVLRHKRQKSRPTQPAEVHLVRLGEIAFASNPFEYYLDFGIQIKVRSPALQTFLIQLAGPGTYVPSPRSVAGGGYGSVPASNPIGPEGGQILAEHTVHGLKELF